jgi:hypothetical protein
MDKGRFFIDKRVDDKRKAGKGIIWCSTFGPEDISHRRQEEMRKLYVRISSIRSKRIDESIK